MGAVEHKTNATHSEYRWISKILLLLFFKKLKVCAVLAELKALSSYMKDDTLLKTECFAFMFDILNPWMTSAVSYINTGDKNISDKKKIKIKKEKKKSPSNPA